MPDPTMSQALKEAYASAPTGVIIYHTLELRHPAFTQPIRVVRDYTDLTATLEASAPANPGQAVLFTSFAFDFIKPEQSHDGVPRMTIVIDNVSRLITASLDQALTTTDPLAATYREFISTDLTGPQNDPPLHMEILSVTGDVFQVRAVAGFADLVNRRFPTEEYGADRFPGLVT